MKRFLCALLAAALLFPAGVLAEEAPQRRSSWEPSDEIVTFIANQEGFRAAPHRSGGRWYVGYGTQIRAGQYADGISREEARELLLEDIGTFAGYLDRYLAKYGLTVTQNQYDALLSFTHNLSTAWMKESATLSRYLIAGAEKYSDLQIVNAFGDWCRAGGQVLPGLARRRIAEARIFLYGDYGDGAEGAADFTYLRFDPGEGEMEDTLVYYVKGQPYGEFPGAQRDGCRLAAWATEDGGRLLPSDCAGAAQTVEAVWTTGETERRYLSLSPFADVSVYDWYYDEIRELYDGGVIGGYGGGLYRPGDPVSCGAALKLVLLAAGCDVQKPTGENTFSGYYDFALQKGFLDDGEISDLTAEASRLLVARLAARAMGLAPSGEGSPYADTEDGYAAALYDAGIMRGKDRDGVHILAAEESIRRGEMAVVVWRLARWKAEETLSST